jgi:hypothetical protein
MTKRERAIGLHARLKRGPYISFNGPFGPVAQGSPLGKECEAYLAERYAIWFDTWISDELKDLIPSLREEST